jgi:peptidoglycan/xylan/chitin deacetylase (PgdA/CDA1 family)
MEIELGWGVHHLPGATGLDRHSPERRAETEMLERLLSTCDRLGIPISFDVVGHLLLDSCSGEHDGPHSDGWFDADPGTDVDTDPLYYAPDLVERVVESETDHEICTHTFSHVPCSDVGEAVVDWELATARDRHESFGLEPPETLVPPMHSPPPTEPLNSNGITGVRRPVTYRAPVETPEPPDSLIRRVPWVVRQLYPVQVLARSHPIRRPRSRDGIVEHYTGWHASLTAPYLPNGRAEPSPAVRVLPKSVRQSLHGRYLHTALQMAVDRDSHAHLWSHLFNLSNELQWDPVRSFLESLARRRDRGEMTVSTMADVTRRREDADA